MPKKKQPKNAFYFFMLDFRNDLEERGHKIRGGMKEVADLAGPDWAALPQEDRMKYEEMAAEHKFRDKHDLTNKFTTTGVSYAQLQAEERERRSIEMRMNNEIIGTVQKLHRTSTLKTHIFYFVHFNYYCRDEAGDYIVCEVAIAQFNLNDGVKDTYHALIRQDKIPTGFTFEAKSTSDESHQIPLPEELKEGEHWKHGTLFCSIKSFLEQHRFNNVLPPLYTIPNHVEVAQNALTTLAEFHHPQNPDIFRVYPLPKLFYHLRNAAAAPGAPGFPTESLAERELDKDVYNFAPGIACSMHENSDTCVFCSKSIVTRWAYLICDHCCGDLDIKMSRGHHVPLNAALEEPCNEEENGFVLATKRKGRIPSTTNANTAASVLKNYPKRETVSSPWAQDFGKSGPQEDTAPLTINAASTSSQSRTVGNCWGVKPDGPLRHPTKLPPSVQNALHFTEEDFPDLGGRNNSKIPAAVAGRGRGKARILEEERIPGGLGSDEESRSSFHAAGRGMGKDGKSGSRLAANLGGLQLN